ncbi:hypothetical protein EOI86_14155 [Hwanghaeella grinnelliae]|uniref:O-antigen ligase domain-containing protein n=1 Tax=Hwanghaeella grinnelliae TaxID=2500179 RepID=A0A3S2VMG2_9PROT|nr:hypothetical protein [Hwanghaeella grinnelliae]RVU36350.1 hypothetical protein EOI86_14155 [Hwanghaeella grinnelliae]
MSDGGGPTAQIARPGGEEPPRSVKWSWGEKPPQLYLLCALAFLSAPVGLIAPDNFSVLLLTIGGLALMTNPVSGSGPIRRQRYLYPLVALLIWVGLSLFWSTGDRQAIDGFLKLAIFTGFGVLLVTFARELREKDKRLLGRWLIPTVWAYCALFLFDRLADNPLTGLLKADADSALPGTALLLLSWPAAGFLFHTDKPVQALVLLMTAGLVQAGANAQAIVLAWLVGGMAAGLAAVLPRITAGLLGSVSVIAIFAAPVLAAQSGLIQRLMPGALALSDAISNRPLLGLGLGGGLNAAAGPSGTLPHQGSAILQIWLDLGIVGAAILGALVTMLAFAGWTGPPAPRAARLGLLAAAFVLAYFGHGAWQTWWVATLFITGAFAAALPDRLRNR